MRLMWTIAWVMHSRFRMPLVYKFKYIFSRQSHHIFEILLLFVLLLIIRVSVFCAYEINKFVVKVQTRGIISEAEGCLWRWRLKLFADSFKLSFDLHKKKLSKWCNNNLLMLLLTSSINNSLQRFYHNEVKIF